MHVRLNMTAKVVSHYHDVSSWQQYYSICLWV